MIKIYYSFIYRKKKDIAKFDYGRRKNNQYYGYSDTVSIRNNFYLFVNSNYTKIWWNDHNFSLQQSIKDMIKYIKTWKKQ